MSDEKSEPGPVSWVAARATCSAKQQFEVLRELAQSDTASRNETLKNERYRFRDGTDPSTEDAFVVWDLLAGARRAVEFALDDDRIVIASDPKKWTLFVTLGLDLEGRCRFRIDGGNQAEAWQVMKAALEDLFFSRG